MKKFAVLTCTLFLCTKFLYAQLSYNYLGYSIGAGAGVTRADADLTKHLNKGAAFVNFNYNLSPFSTLTTELQAGQLAGGDPHTDKDTRGFINTYEAILLYGDFQAGEIINYEDNRILNALKNFYAGTGFGFIHNQMTFIQRKSLNNPGYVFPGRDASIEIMLVFRAGYEFKFYNQYHEPGVRLDVGYEENLAYGEGLDGYDDPPTQFRNNHVDRYAFVHVGLKYNFGNPVSFRKPIRRFYY
ncbi:MAG: hypothetical protein ACRYFB_00190 [Janthinobacterium lividum]